MMKSFKVAALVAALVSAPMMAEEDWSVGTLPYGLHAWEWFSIGFARNEEGVRVSTGKHAYISHSINHTARIYFSLPNREDCEKESEETQIIDIDGQYVWFDVFCEQNGKHQYMTPKSDKGMNHVVSLFKKKQFVTIANTDSYGAIGFTKAWNAAIAEQNKRKAAL